MMGSPMRNILIAVPSVMMRLDSYEPTPKRGEPTKLWTSFAQQPFAHGLEPLAVTCAKPEQPQALSILQEQYGPSPIALSSAIGCDTVEGGTTPDHVKPLKQYGEYFFLRLRDERSPPLLKGATLSQHSSADKNGEAVEDIGRWYFAHRSAEHDHEFFEYVQDYWDKNVWDLGRVSEPLSPSTSAFALNQKAIHVGPLARIKYYEQKGRIIQDVMVDIKRRNDGINASTIAAMAALAYLDIRERQFAASETHLRAIAAFVDMSSLSTQGWLHCAWTDLRHALFTIQEPMLPFYITDAHREAPMEATSYERDAFGLGFINASQCSSSSLLTPTEATDLFGRLNTLCYCSNNPKIGRPPSIGTVYALEYRLRVVQARARLNKGHDMSAPSIMLITSAIQLHVWIATRFHMPQAYETHARLAEIAFETLAGFDDLIKTWSNTSEINCLLWVLFTLYASVRTQNHPQALQVLKLLYDALRTAGIYTGTNLESKLRCWPWLDDWHPVQFDMVWDKLSARYPDLVPCICLNQKLEGMSRDSDATR